MIDKHVELTLLIYIEIEKKNIRFKFYEMLLSDLVNDFQSDKRAESYF